MAVKTLVLAERFTEESIRVLSFWSTRVAAALILNTGSLLARVFRLRTLARKKRRPIKASNFSKAQKASILKQGNDGTPATESCRKAGISHTAYFN